MHRDVFTQDLGADDRVLGEVLRNAAADHQKARRPRLDLDFRELPKILHRVDGEVRLGMLHLVENEAEAGAAVREGRAEDRDVMLEGRLDEGLLLDAVPGQVAPHLPDEFPRGIGAGGKAVGDLLDRFVAGLKVILVDKGVVNPVDVQFPEDLVVRERRPLVVPETEGLEKIHIHDRRPRGDDGVDHAVLHHLDVDLHAAGGAGAPRDGQDDTAFLFGKHSVIDVGGARQITGGEGHPLHRLNDRRGVERGDVDVPNRRL